VSVVESPATNIDPSEEVIFKMELVESDTGAVPVSGCIKLNPALLAVAEPLKKPETPTCPELPEGVVKLNLI
jgi:hypothetical protein